MTLTGSKYVRLGLIGTVCAGAAAFGLARSDLVFEPLEQRLLFRPRLEDRSRLEVLAARGRGIEDVRLQTEDGLTLHGWLKHPATAAGGRFPLVIVLGGVRRETSWLIDRGDKPERWGWLFVNYRGFGLSEGLPSGRAIEADVHRIFDYAAARADVDPDNIVVLGRSLGAYFTTVLAKTRKVRGVILATPFDSFAALGRERYPWFPVSLIVNGRYDAAAIAPRIAVPGLFLVAENDNVTPPERGLALARAWGGPQRIVTLAGARHYGVERRDDFWRPVAEFLRSLEAPGSKQAGQSGISGRGCAPAC